MASVSLHTDYAMFCDANLEQKKKLLLDNIFRSLKVVKGRLKNKFDYDQIEVDINSCISQIEVYWKTDAGQ